MFEGFIKCCRPFKRAAMTLISPTVKMSLTPLGWRLEEGGLTGLEGGEEGGLTGLEGGEEGGLTGLEGGEEGVQSRALEVQERRVGISSRLERTQVIELLSSLRERRHLLRNTKASETRLSRRVRSDGGETERERRMTR
ncbi:hypothetical protein EYF80_067333 [Liparis tanakae]|uniref:Uncharacterized protein n=1 Tax=Liparis tanakae TaxID=230148 RepID=A0A4Z2E1B7_9TELE|nr:hypothetical protein EYF80_067333 [Liparis tanakae]